MKGARQKKKKRKLTFPQLLPSSKSPTRFVQSSAPKTHDPRNKMIRPFGHPFPTSRNIKEIGQRWIFETRARRVSRWRRKTTAQNLEISDPREFSAEGGNGEVKTALYPRSPGTSSIFDHTPRFEEFEGHLAGQERKTSPVPSWWIGQSDWPERLESGDFFTEGSTCPPY